MCEMILEAIDRIAMRFRDPENGDLYQKRKSEASTDDVEIILSIDNEIETYLNYLNVKHNIEIISNNMVQGVLCVSFCIDGELGTYNESMYM